MDHKGFDRIIGPGLELATPVGWDAYLANLLETYGHDLASLAGVAAVQLAAEGDISVASGLAGDAH
jgi:hypothetical protein